MTFISLLVYVLRAIKSLCNKDLTNNHNNNNSQEKYLTKEERSETKDFGRQECKKIKNLKTLSLALF